MTDEERLKAITDVDEEIELLESHTEDDAHIPETIVKFKRILARLQAHRETLTRGMRQDKESHD